MNKLRLAAILALLALALAACESQPAPVVDVGAGTPAAGTAPEAGTAPQAGKATVIGRVLSQQSGTPLTNTSVRLAEVYREGDEGAFVLDGANSPGAMTDSTGGFVIPNIEAREYVVVIGDPYGKNAIVPESSGKARVWNATADQVLNLGDVRVDLDE